ncbi:hypothetical protein PT974_02976 [Cladobotryum mycophilum]|uniref:Uncharacterized protein n=1 Tax=Cladobotryum mycophilum TaxID=491253 RepID=A0ABR0SZT6_9HYPO
MARYREAGVQTADCLRESLSGWLESHLGTSMGMVLIAFYLNVVNDFPQKSRDPILTN